MIWHIIKSDAWISAENQGTYRAPSLESEGFIHCSTINQLLDVANNFYAGQKNLLILGIDPAKVPAEIRYEDCYETGQDFPHVYGAIPVTAVTQVMAFPPDSDGHFELPSGLTFE
jgi:uncharacterized protein (DUF952 family)